MMRFYMKKRQSFYAMFGSTVGAIQISGLYLLIGGLWILFSDKVAEKVALNQEMLATISLYKGWGYVIITALLLYWLIQRHTAALHASEERLQRVLDAMPAFISYVDANRQYRFTNKTYEEWFQDPAKGKHVEEVLGKASYQRISKYMDKALAGETTSYETEVLLQGQELFVRSTYIPDMAADKRVKGFFVLSQDRTQQKQAEEELRQWADAFEGCAHGIAISDPSTNRILVCNSAFASLHKCRVEDIVGSGILSLFASSDYDQVRRNIERADQIGHASFEARMIRRDRSKFPVQMDIVSVLGEDGELLHRVLTAQDISERKSIDEKLKASETKYRTLVEHLPAITYISQPDQYIGVSYISPQIEELGFDSETWLADPEFWFKQIHPEDQEQVSFALQQFESSDEPCKADYRLILPNDEIRWFHDESIRVKDQDGKTILKQGFMLDITERKHVEETLRKSEMRFRALVEHSSIGFDLFDAQHRMVYYAPSNEQLLGYTLEERLQKPPQELIHPEDREGARAWLAEVYKNPGKVLSTEFRLCHKNGSWVWVEAMGKNLLADPNVQAVVINTSNITGRKQAEEEIQSLARFPDENPNPVLRATAEGKIIYANASGECLLNCWQCRVGEMLPPDLVELISELVNTGAKQTIELPCEDAIYSVMLASVPSANYINLYGRDITESKRAEKAEQLERARWQGIVEGIADEVWTCDP